MTEIALIGKKIGMTREFYKTGQSVPVTVVKMEKAKVIDVIEEEKYKKGEAELNDSLSQGYRIVTEYQTPNGIVFSLSKYMNKYEKDPNQKSMDDYCIGSMKGGLQ